MELEKKILQHAGSLYAICYSEKMDLVFTGGVDKIVASWNPITFQNTDFSIKTKSTILSLSIVNDNNLLIGLFNGDVHLIDLNKRKEIKYIKHHEKGVFASDSDPLNKLFAIGSGDGLLSVWDSENYEMVFSSVLDSAKIRAIVCHDNKMYIGTSKGLMYVLDNKTLVIEKSYIINETGINSLCFLPQKNAVLVGGKDAYFSIFSLDKKEIVFKVAAHNWAIYKILIANKHLYSCSRDKTIKEWDMHSLDPVKRYCYPDFKAHTHSVNNLVYIEKHAKIVSAGDDKAVCFWKL